MDAEVFKGGRSWAVGELSKHEGGSGGLHLLAKCSLEKSLLHVGVRGAGAAAVGLKRDG